MVVCITGMHRSGTSMVARLLNLCGLHLGEETELIGAAKDNTDGFWENIDFVNLNNEIMLKFNGGWDVPPKVKQGWETSSKISAIRDQARQLLKRFGGHKNWGWKDPRNSITLPFWQQLIPDMKIIVCMRNPLDVAHSLARRGYASETFSFNLWYTYNQRLLDAVPSESYIITHYDTYFINPEAELRRLLKFIKIPIQKELVEAAVITPSRSMRHSRSTVDDLISAKVPEKVLSLYLDMCSQAGPIYWGELYPSIRQISNAQIPHSATSQLGLLVRLAEREKALLEAKKTLAQKEQTITQKEQTITQKEQTITQKEQTITQKEQTITQKEQTIQEFKIIVQNKDHSLQRLEFQVLETKSALEILQNGIAYKLIGKYRIFIERILPHGTRRGRFYNLTIRGLSILLFEGPRSLWHRVHKQESHSAPEPEDDAESLKKYSPPSDMMVASHSIYTSEENLYAKIYDEAMTVAREPLGSKYVPLAETSFSEEAKVKLIAYYLPQYHPIPENDEWWGKGFTEWSNVSKAVPQFIGHYQPHLPGELGFYDLRVLDVQRRQVELAKQYGIYGFCFYYYWFNGKRLLERPLEQFLTNPDIDFPFCLCWANENWTRRWDGMENEVLIAQKHSAENDLAFIEDIKPILQHKKYIRIDNRPLLIVYRAQLLPDPANTAKRWRRYCIDAGIGDPYLVAAQVFGFSDPRLIGFDAAVEFPPNNMDIQDINRSVNIINPSYSGKVYRYTDVQTKLTASNYKPAYKLFKTVFPGWDNEARGSGRGFTFILSSPNAYKDWLIRACRITMQSPNKAERLVFINAWNEWAEGAHLEPDRKFGYAYLQATADALRSLPEPELNHDNQPASSSDYLAKVVKRHETAVIFHLFYIEMWEEFDHYLTNLNGDFDLFVSIPEDVEFQHSLILSKYPQAYIYRPKNQGRDIAPFINIFLEIYPLQYKYVCKVHTKRSTHRQDGHIWRQDLMEKLLGSQLQVEVAKHTLDENPDIGIVAPEGHVVPGSFYWGKNERMVHMLAQRVGIPWNKQNFQFVAGSMFWFKPSAVYPITLLELSRSDFEAEQGQVDGTLAHALERFLGLLTQSSGFRIMEIGLNGNVKDTVHSASLDYRFVKV